MLRIPIGVDALDQSLVGGLPKGSVTLLLGPPGSGKTILSRKFLYGGLRNGDPSILVSTSESYDTVKETVKQFRWEASAFEKLLFLDCYSWRIGGSGQKYQASLSSLTDVSIALGKLVEEVGIDAGKNSRLVIDSFTDIIKYGGGERALKLIDALRMKLHTGNITSLILVEEGVHEDRIVHAVEYSTDGTIRMRFSDQGRFMMVSRMMATPVQIRWMPYLI